MNDTALMGLWLNCNTGIFNTINIVIVGFIGMIQRH
jgi:hypothetical protein